MTISRSPRRNTFQIESYLKSSKKKGKTPENDIDVADMLEYYTDQNRLELEREEDPKWQKNNLEYDLRTTNWILEKARAREEYAQNIYAALCNNGFTKLEVIPILTEQEWSCSWRHAGGVVADMLKKGDYIDWYCSGIRDSGDDKFNASGFVPEGHITDEVREDLKKLGWIPAAGGDWEMFK